MTVKQEDRDEHQGQGGGSEASGLPMHGDTAAHSSPLSQMMARGSGVEPAFPFQLPAPQGGLGVLRLGSQGCHRPEKCGRKGYRHGLLGNPQGWPAPEGPAAPRVREKPGAPGDRMRSTRLLLDSRLHPQGRLRQEPAEAQNVHSENHWPLV